MISDLIKSKNQRIEKYLTKIKNAIEKMKNDLTHFE